MKKVNVNVQVVNLAGMALGLAGTLLTGWAQTKNTKVEIAKQVEEALLKTKGGN